MLARWLYPGEVRTYNDFDLMVAPDAQARAVTVLGRLGFIEYCLWMPVPLSLDPGGTAFDRSAKRIVDFTVSCLGSMATLMRSGVGSLQTLRGS